MQIFTNILLRKAFTLQIFTNLIFADALLRRGFMQHVLTNALLRVVVKLYFLQIRYFV